MRTIKILLASAILGTALVSTTATSANAQSTTIKDRRADVVRYDGADDTTGTVLDGPASINSGIDAKTARVKHTKKSVAVQMRFSKLTTGKTFTYAGIRVKGKKTWPSYWVYSNGSKTKGAVYDRKGKRLCSAKFTTTTGTNGMINFVVPRSCIKKPTSIKVQVGVVREVKEGDTLTIFDESISATRTHYTTNTTWLKSS